MRGVEHQTLSIKPSRRLGLLQAELRALATPPTPLFSSPGLSTPGVSPILLFSEPHSPTFDDVSFERDSCLNDSEYLDKKNLSSEEGMGTDDSFCSDHESPEYKHQHQQFLSISSSKSTFISIHKRQDILEASYRNLQSQLQSVEPGLLQGSLASQVQTLIQLLCEKSSELNSIFSDILRYEEFFLNEVLKLDALIEQFLKEDMHEKKFFSMRDEKGSLQIDAFPEGNRIILWGVKRKIVEGSFCRFKPHNLVFYCDKNFEKVTHYADIVNSTFKKNKDEILNKRPYFIQMIKLFKNNNGERISFAQLNQGIELNHIITKRENHERLGIDIINQINLSVFTEFLRVSKIQWDKKQVFTDLKAANILLRLKNDKFLITFIDYISNDIADGKSTMIPVSCGKLPIELFMSNNLKRYVDEHPDTLFFDDSIEKPNIYIHPIIAYIQIVVVCVELFLGKYIVQSKTEERAEALRNLDAMFMQHPELTDDILFRRYYMDACDYVVRASSFYMA